MVIKRGAALYGGGCWWCWWEARWWYCNEDERGQVHPLAGLVGYSE
jgi:hypothetical protein